MPSACSMVGMSSGTGSVGAKRFGNHVLLEVFVKVRDKREAFAFGVQNR